MIECTTIYDIGGDLMVKIFLDPGHGGTDPGAVGNGLQEKSLVLTIANLIRDMLLAEYQNVDVRMSRSTDTFVSLTERSRLANQWGADYFVSIHINAGGGTGFESFVHSSRATRTVQLQNTVHDAIMEQLSVTDRGKKSADFAVLRGSSMPAILTENLFIDRVSDANLLKDAAFLRSVARGHVNGIGRAFQLQRKPGTGGSVYRVQSGAFSNETNANQLKTRLEQAGYQPFVRLEAGLYKVQVGAFSNQTNAEAFAVELRSKGFEAQVFLS